MDIRLGDDETFSFQQVTVPARALSGVFLQGEVFDIINNLWQYAAQTVADPHVIETECIASEPACNDIATIPITQHRINDDWHNPIPSEYTNPGEGDNPEEDPDVIPEPIRAPAFVHGLFDMAERHGAFTDLDTDDAFHVRTWYLHHANLPRCTIPRFLELHEDWRRWEGDFRSSWRDFIIPQEAIQFHVATPDPYRGYLHHVLHADLLISQGTWINKKPGLITVHYQGRQTQPLNYAVAASFEPRVSGIDLAAAADALRWCSDPGYQCRILHGWHEIPFDSVPTHRMEPGHAFVIHVWSVLQTTRTSSHSHEDGSPIRDVDMDSSAMPEDAMGHATPSTAQEAMITDSHDREEQDDPPPEDQVSEASIHSGDMGVLVCRLQAPDGHCFVPWNNYMTILDAILHELRLPRREYRCFHVLAVAPVDIREDAEQIVILQAVTDVPAGSNEKLILVDVAIHFHPLPSGLLVPAAMSRRVVRVQQHLHRQQILMLQGLEEYCHIVGERCTVHKNNQLWSAQDKTVHMINHGDYVRIQVPPPDDPTLDTEVAIHVAREFAIDASTLCTPGGATLALYQRTTEVFRFVALQLADFSIDFERFKTDPTATDRPSVPARAAPASTVPLPADTGVRFHPRHFEQLCQIVDQTDLIECEEEGKIAYITTWYLHHVYHKECRQSRAVRLTMPAHHWIDDITAVWHDLLLPDEPTTLRLVTPKPPCH